ncbi:MAG TPA: HEAT repeat domain-containing protein, partial [Planctomycetota bacterium]|nr:HEAT repeat domain-containing protein [Planctomycetota bacterium]
CKEEDLRKVVGEVLRLGGLESMLLELTWMGWTAVFYAGPVFVLLLACAPLAAALAWLTRHRSPQGVRRVIFVVFALSMAGLVAIIVVRSGSMGRVAALRNLPADDQKSLDLLAAGLQDPDPDVRYEAAYQAYMKLTSTSYPRGGLLPELRAGARDPSVRVRLWCAAALGLTKEPSVRADIFQALDDPDMLVRYRACEGLEHMDSKRLPVPPETIKRLKDVIKNRSWYEGMYALDALRKIEPLKH